ncbi:MAG TPA: hypothetical protein VGX94_12635 [Terriglobia bacterium]|nr:hypothetical protein [Terriglobia bacterium]
MAKQGKRSELSLKHRAEGKPVFLGVNVRAALKKRLQEIAVSEDQTLDYIVDQMLRRAVGEYGRAGSMRDLLASSGASGGTQG